MSLRVRLAWATGVIAVLVSISATAEPPFFKDNNRIYGHWVVASRCENIENGFRCLDINGSENYDVKGNYRSTEVAQGFYFYRSNPIDGSWREGWRYLSCAVSKDAILANPNRVTLEATLDPGAPECWMDGYRAICDPVTGCQYSPWGFPGPREITGEWKKPVIHGSSVMNIKDSFHDDSANYTNTFIQHCNRTWGERMNDGGFSVNDQVFPFSADDWSLWNAFDIMRCNDKYKAQ